MQFYTCTTCTKITCRLTFSAHLIFHVSVAAPFYRISASVRLLRLPHPPHHPLIPPG